MHKYKSSIIYYDIILNSYYDSDYTENAQYGKALAYLALKDIQKAREEFLLFKDKFPNSQISQKVEKQWLWNEIKCRVLFYICSSMISSSSRM